MVLTYNIGKTTTGDHFIKCLVCGRTSYNANDISNKYCGHCHRFHDTVKPTFDTVLQAARDKNYLSMFPEHSPDQQEIELACIMAWLNVKHKSPVNNYIVMWHRMKHEPDSVLSEILAKILSLN